MFSFKKKSVPSTNETKQVDVVKLWVVSWNRVYQNIGYHWRSEKAMEWFPSKESAKEFAASLNNAAILLKDDVRDIKVTENI